MAWTEQSAVSDTWKRLLIVFGGFQEDAFQTDAFQMEETGLSYSWGKSQSLTTPWNQIVNSVKASFFVQKNFVQANFTQADVTTDDYSNQLSVSGAFVKQGET